MNCPCGKYTFRQGDERCPECGLHWSFALDEILAALSGRIRALEDRLAVHEKNRGQ